jgi:hypothetical protein
MTAKLLCVCASVLGAALGACIPVSSEVKDDGAAYQYVQCPKLMAG